MTYNYLFYILLLVIAILLGRAVWILRQILRILALKNRGIPDASDMATMSLEDMAQQKK